MGDFGLHLIGTMEMKSCDDFLHLRVMDIHGVFAHTAWRVLLNRLPSGLRVRARGNWDTGTAGRYP